MERTAFATPAVEVLNELLNADFEAGKLYWKKRSVALFANVKEARWWNSRFAGKEALASVNSTGAKSGTIFDVRYQAHRILWKMAKGFDPICVDHINGNRADNRISNLRAATPSENARNSKRRSNNTSGQMGIHWSKERSVWIVMLKVDGKNRYVGRTKDMSEAIRMRDAAYKEHGYHSNHGRSP